MKIYIKQLNNTGFNVEVEPHESVGDLKAKIHAASLEAGGAELVVERQTLICRGKKLTDSSALISDISGLAEEEEPYMVCMLSKEKKAKTTAPAPAPAVETNSTGTSGTLPSTTTTAPSTTTTTPATTTTTAPAPAPAPAAVQNFVEESTLASLQEMSGLPEQQCRAALQAAMGNPDVAFEFLMTGIPPGMENGAAAMQGQDLPTVPPTAGATAGAGTGGIEALRNHPQFAQLQATVQQNPAALPQILQLIGQQQPELLQAIHENEGAFLEMMNEPINTATPPAAPTPGGGQAGQTMPGMAGALGGMGAGAGGRPNPAMLMQLLAALPPEQRGAFATQLGLSPEQLQGLMAAIQQVPPDQLAAMMNQMGGEDGMGGMGGPPPGSIALTQEEMAAVTRLQELGFSQSQAAQAFIASDKNEEVAANMLFEGTFNYEDEEGGGGGL